MLPILKQNIKGNLKKRKKKGLLYFSFTYFTIKAVKASKELKTNDVMSCLVGLGPGIKSRAKLNCPYSGKRNNLNPSGISLTKRTSSLI